MELKCAICGDKNADVVCHHCGKPLCAKADCRYLIPNDPAFTQAPTLRQRVERLGYWLANQPIAQPMMVAYHCPSCRHKFLWWHRHTISQAQWLTQQPVLAQPPKNTRKRIMTITIRPINTVEHCQYFQEIERRVWASEDLDIMPMHVLITVAKNGGVFLGAYASDGPPELEGLVGMTIGWYGMGENKTIGHQQLKFCSHMAGVLVGWQGQRIGLQLKLAQREAVLAQGLTEWITWTYDPLYRANAVFNIHRLGAICTTYYPNHYGTMNDALNAGAPSDRCQVDWYLKSDHVVLAIEEKSITSPEKKRQILPTAPSGDFRQPIDAELSLDGMSLAVPLPDNITPMRQADQALGLAWRFYLRKTLQQAFAAGYVLTDCVQLADQGWHYLLEPRHA